MRFRYLLLIILPLLIVLGSCGKKCNDEKQVNIDDSIIQKFLSEKGIAAQKHSSGIYYQILSQGSGNIAYSANTSITAKYTGRLLDGKIFDNGRGEAITFKLGGVITGWQIGIPLIQKGGKIRLIIPSGLAYGCDGRDEIPKNAVLDFDVELVNVTN
ncbi:FKBP-type peptidyl-prolyl cis-trans isomerase [Daejeonella lutea]|uniref:Peptidyl-prolyl cis-trans isomerase n=1 Tax=Daejeonella lutea TaxID=572036 RepID=A0A1T5EFW3_9SPHI|nr:FKBP-type peptidyl-prolyl cis-trans isomerase [Daejeonella lutea]SKB82862.1 FKBP-type peptidyl-prolyl cis-trans isomerase FkpA [Daejeonella lutea]